LVQKAQVVHDQEEKVHRKVAGNSKHYRRRENARQTEPRGKSKELFHEIDAEICQKEEL
jgi:hypothetical protein